MGPRGWYRQRMGIAVAPTRPSGFRWRSGEQSCLLYCERNRRQRPIIEGLDDYLSSEETTVEQSLVGPRRCRSPVYTLSHMASETSPYWLDRLRERRARGRIVLCSPLAWLALSTSARESILADVAKWSEYASLPGLPSDSLRVTAAYIAESRAFRTLLYYRLRHCSSPAVRLMMPVLSALWRPHPTLILHPESLGPGCFILHGDSTMVGARSIGKNFVVGQHVVVGYRAPGELPTIGDNVSIYVGAIVMGELTIGDDATIGVGAVVTNSVPDGATVVPLPARPVPVAPRSRKVLP